MFVSVTTATDQKVINMTSSTNRQVATPRQGIWYDLLDDEFQSREIDASLVQAHQMNSSAIILYVVVPVILFAVIFVLLTLVAVFVIRRRKGRSDIDARLHICLPIDFGRTPPQKHSEAATSGCTHAGVISKKSCFSFSGAVTKTKATNERSSLLIDTQDELPVEESPRPPPRKNGQSSEGDRVTMALAVSRLEPLRSVGQMPQRDYEELLDYLLSCNNSEASTVQPTVAPHVQSSQNSSMQLSRSNTPLVGSSRISHTTDPGLMQHFSNWHDGLTACPTCRCHLGHSSNVLLGRAQHRHIELPRQNYHNRESPHRQYQTLQRNPLGHDYDPVYVPRHDPIAMSRRVDNETGYIKSLQSRGAPNSNIRRGQPPAENAMHSIGGHSTIT